MVYIVKSEDTEIVSKIYNTLLVVASEFEASKFGGIGEGLERTMNKFIDTIKKLKKNLRESMKKESIYLILYPIL